MSKAIATLDHVSRGRAGWQPVPQPSEQTADLFGVVAPAGQAAVVELAEVTDVTKKLWDSWEDDAIIKDVDTGRFVDRSKLHYVDYQGQNFSVKGPSITPRPPQGHPVTVVAVGNPNTGTPGDSASEVDGVILQPAEPLFDLKVLTEVVIPELVRAGIRPAQHYPHPKLRQNLGLPRPTSIYATANLTNNPVGA